MKDSKFIELLNLYVDQEISPEDSLLLEREITDYPERKKLYLQYCRMHRASVMLCESFRSEQAPAGSKLARAAKNADEKIARYPERKRASGFSWGWYGTGGIAVAAACAVFLISKSEPVTQLPQNTLVSHTPARETAVPSLPVAAQSPAESMRSVKPMLVARSLEQRYGAAGNRFEGSNPASTLEWMTKVEIPPMKGLSMDDQPFDVRNALEQMPVNFRNQEPIKGRVEMTAFQFQR